MTRHSILPEPIFPFADFIQTSNRNEIIISPIILKKHTKRGIMELIRRAQNIRKFDQMGEYELACVKEDIWIIKKKMGNTTISIMLHSYEL